MRDAGRHQRVQWKPECGGTWERGVGWGRIGKESLWKKLDLPCTPQKIWQGHQGLMPAKVSQQSEEFCVS